MFATETLAEVYRCKKYSALDNTSPHFKLYEKTPEFINSEIFDVKSTQSLHILKSQMEGHKKYNMWVKLTEQIN